MEKAIGRHREQGSRSSRVTKAKPFGDGLREDWRLSLARPAKP